MVTAKVGNRDLEYQEGVWFFSDNSEEADKITLSILLVQEAVELLSLMLKNYASDRDNGRRLSLAITNVEQAGHWLGDIDNFTESE